MSRVVLKGGVLVPLEPLPADWREGQELVVSEGEADTAPADLDRWYQQLQALGVTHYEPGEKEQVAAVMREADEQAKAFVRRQMGLP